LVGGSYFHPSHAENNFLPDGLTEEGNYERGILLHMHIEYGGTYCSRTISINIAPDDDAI